MSDATGGLGRSQPPDGGGPIAWMVANRVAANTLAAVLLLGGLLMMGTLRQEVFPEFQPDVVSIEVPYPGASPEEVEQGVVLAIEEALRGIDAVETVTALAREDHAQVVAELFLRADRDRAFNDVQAAVGRITTFPEDAESPVVMLPSPRIEVVSLILHGDFHRRTLRQLAESARNELLRGGVVTHVEVTGIPPVEISIEVPQENLRKYQLTLAQVADAAAAASIDLPAGEVRAAGGEIAIRTTEERRSGQAFADVVLRALPDGTQLRLGDVADVVDGFRETALQSYFNDQPAVRLRVFRVGEQQPLEIAAAVRELAERWRTQMPPSVGVAIWNDYSVFYRDRIGMLVEKALMGLVLVLLVLGAFLHPRLALWVSLGIAIAFLGGLLLMPPLGVTINMISLFAFILVLGIVVDDAIVVGEAVHANSRAGPRGGFAPADAAVAGAREVAVPVTFAVATTIVAFVPMLFVPGIAGDFFRNIPLIAIPILLISLLHGFFVLPAQLSASKGLRAEPEPNRAFRWVVERQAKLAHGLDALIERHYLPFARRVIALRYLTLALALAVTLVLFGLVVGGRVDVTFMEDIEGEVVTASFVMPFGTPVEQSRPIARRLAAEAERAVTAVGGGAEHVLGVFVQTGSLDPEGLGLEDELVLQQQGGHVGAASLLLVQADERPFSSRQLAEQWRHTAHWPAG
ncbi:MAG: efflux RND transporter permease subunit, partial [Pseudomonadales bacterium]